MRLSADTALNHSLAREARPEDVLRDVYVLKRKAAAAVYAVITFDLPLYFVFGYTWTEVAILAVVGWVIAGAAIQFSFTQIIRLRKRTAYPALLMLELGDPAGLRAAPEEVLAVLETLLRTESSFIALASEGTMVVRAVRNTTEAEAEQVIRDNAHLLETAVDNRYPMEIERLRDGTRRVFVPVVALRKRTGVLYLTGPRRSELGDRSLLEAIGSAVGLSLDNLHQKEELAQKESRLRKVITGAPVVLFTVNRAGITTFIEGRGMERLGITPDAVLGRPIWELYENYPEVLHSFRRAFAGDEVTSTATIEMQGVQTVFEYRLAPEREESGRVTGIICIATDITERRHAEDAQHASERAMATLLSNLPGYAFRSRIDDWTPEFVSNGVVDLTGRTASEFLDGTVTPADIIHPGDLPMVREAMARAVARREPYSIEYRLVAADGSEKWAWEQGGPVSGEDDDEPVAIEGFISDITKRKRAEQALAESEERFRDIFENARDAMFSYNLSGRFVGVNRRNLELLGYTKSEFMTLNVGEVVAPEDHIASAEALKRVMQGDSTPYEIEIVAKDGRRVPMEITSRIVCDRHGRPRLVHGIGRDISARKQAEETIRRLAYHDALTGLPNRALFEDRLEMAIAQARRETEMLSVIFLDLDGFKVVNDTLGHSAGDRLLEFVARDLSALIRAGDTVARVGGDEFTLLLPAIERAEDAIEIAQRMLECLRQPRMVNGREFRTTGSIGVTTYPGDGEDGETLLRNADTAMYRAKERGRDNYQLYTPAMNEKIMARLAVEHDLRHALARDELRLFYQPIVNVQSGEVTAAEALLRWDHPVRGLMEPDWFIPLAEETGLIVEIGEWVLRESCRQMLGWQEHGLNLSRIAVNLSARQLQQEDLVARIGHILHDTGLSARYVQLEITERAVLKNVDYIISMLTQLRAMGVGIALDDFGTGYSSLTYLKRFPVDTVKIDRSFVQDLQSDASDATIVSTVIAMAENLRLRVIAEGVETEEQLQFLRERGCDEFQGYLFAKPLEADALEQLVLRQPQVNGRRKAARRDTAPAG